MFSGITTADLGMSRALLVAVCGLVIVFIMLAVLALMITIISKIVAFVEGKSAHKASESAPVSPATPPAPAASAQNQDELVVVIAAAIAAETDLSPDQFRITNIQG